MQRILKRQSHEIFHCWFIGRPTWASDSYPKDLSIQLPINQGIQMAHSAASIFSKLRGVSSMDDMGLW
jgi:hypothetical protein